LDARREYTRHVLLLVFSNKFVKPASHIDRDCYLIDALNTTELLTTENKNIRAVPFCQTGELFTSHFRLDLDNIMNRDGSIHEKCKHCLDGYTLLSRERGQRPAFQKLGQPYYHTNFLLSAALLES